MSVKCLYFEKEQRGEATASYLTKLPSYTVTSSLSVSAHRSFTTGRVFVTRRLILINQSFMFQIHTNHQKVKLNIWLTLDASNGHTFELIKSVTNGSSTQSADTRLLVENSTLKRAEDVTHRKVIFYHKHRFSLLCHSATVIAPIYLPDGGRPQRTFCCLLFPPETGSKHFLCLWGF